MQTDKLKKLLGLTTSPNDHEALVAGQADANRVHADNCARDDAAEKDAQTLND